MVTNNSANLQSFYSNPNAALDGALRLSKRIRQLSGRQLCVKTKLFEMIFIKSKGI